MARTRDEWMEEVSHPGKFEGEAAYVPFYWDAYLDGMADDDDGEVLTFEVTDADRALFPELAGQDRVYLVQSDDGFVCEVASPEPVDEGEEDAD